MANLTSICDSEFAASMQITASLKKLIIEQFISAQRSGVCSIKAQVHQDWRETSREHALEIRNSLSPQLQRVFDLNSEPGASSWLLTLPSFSLN